MIYDIKTDTWSEKVSKPVNTFQHGEVIATGAISGRYAPKKIYVLEGFIGSLCVRNRVYDAVGNIWSTAKDMPAYRTSFGIAVVDDILYVIGGLDFAEPLPDHAVGGAIGPISLNEQYVPIGYSSAPNGSIPTVNCPVVNILSPLNQIYSENTVFLEFTVDKPVVEIGYSLDKQARVTIVENTTLIGLSAGEHTITVYALDYVGNIGISTTTVFTVSSDSSDALLIFIAVAVLVLIWVIITTVLVVYFKTQKKVVD
jgi:hypothetical protein